MESVKLMISANVSIRFKGLSGEKKFINYPYHLIHAYPNNKVCSINTQLKEHKENWYEILRDTEWQILLETAPKPWFLDTVFSSSQDGLKILV